MAFIFRTFFIGVVFATSALFPVGSAYAAVDDLKYEKEAAKAINEFAIDMYLQLAKSEGGNIFFGSHCISSALAMTYAGASGESAKKMATVMHFGPNIHKGMGLLDRSIKSSNDAKDGCQIWVANAVWPAKDGRARMTESFERIIKNDYRSDIQMLNYRWNPEGSRKTINKWVEGKTNNRIKNLIPSGVLNRYTSMVLTSATYFKGEWARPFKKKDTMKAPFYLAGKSGKQGEGIVDLMFQEAKFLYEASEEAQMLAMAYKGSRYHMVFILPSKGTALTKYEQALGQGKAMKQLHRLLNDSKSHEKVRVYIPKFKMEKSYSLMNHLENLGLRGIVCNNMLESRKTGEAFPQGFDAVLHKSFIELDEEKTEAAAATAVVMKAIMARPIEQPPVPVFRADRPFIYLLVDRNSGAILYMGRFVKPGMKVRERNIGDGDMLYKK